MLVVPIVENTCEEKDLKVEILKFLHLFLICLKIKEYLTLLFFKTDMKDFWQEVKKFVAGRGALTINPLIY